MNPALAAVRNLSVGANLASLSMLGRPRHMLAYISETLFLQRLFTGYGLPAKNVWEVVGSGSRETIELLNLDGQTWFHRIPTYACDIVSLCALARALKPKVIFEIGTLNGYTAFHFAANSEADVYTLDLPPGQTGTLNTTIIDRAFMKMHEEIEQPVWEAQPEAGRIHQLYGDSAKFDFSRWRGKVDLFFIDGAHSYEYVRNDTLRALECCHQGSLIAWHDYGRCGVNGVTRWVHRLAETLLLYRIPGGSLAFGRMAPRAGHLSGDQEVLDIILQLAIQPGGLAPVSAGPEVA